MDMTFEETETKMETTPWKNWYFHVQKPHHEETDIDMDITLQRNRNQDGDDIMNQHHFINKSTFEIKKIP